MLSYVYRREKLIVVPDDLPHSAVNKRCVCTCYGSWPSATKAVEYDVQGRRALDFVLKNQGLIDKTLLFDIELMRINQ